MKKAILIFPEIEFFPVQYPTGLYQLATYCKNHYDVIVLDQRLLKEQLFQTIDFHLSQGNTLCIGLSVMTGTQIKNAIEISKHYQKRIPIVWGGLHPTILPTQTIADDYVDYVIRGEGESAFLQLLSFLDTGIASEKSFLTRGCLNNTYNVFEDFANAEYIDFEKFPVAEQYIVKRDGFARAFSLETSRGCPYGCAYCHNTAFKKRYRKKNADHVIEVINELITRYMIDGIVFQEDNFFITDTRSARIIEYLSRQSSRSPIGWKANCRIDFMLKKIEDKKFMNSLRSSHCHLLQFGAESGSNRILKLINKGIQVQDIIRLNQKLSGIPIKVRYNFIVGFPGETMQEINSTLTLIDQLKAENPNMDAPFLNIYTPYPGTPLFAEAQKLGLQSPQNTEGWINYQWNSCVGNWLDVEAQEFLTRLSKNYINNSQYLK